jgi:prepilin-type N-terminal cleavage/methylation domain-containing protein
MIQTINRTKKDRGFTIVELLVVIVVIGILAAITIVSYTGVTTRAKNAQAASNAAAAQSVAEAINADTGSYPATAAAFALGSTSTRLPSGMSVVPGLAGTVGTDFTGQPASIATLWGTTIVAANFPNTVTWACYLTCTTPTGGRITYYDFSNATQSTTVVFVGAAKTNTVFVAPAT